MIARIAHIKWKETPTAVLFETVTVLLTINETKHYLKPSATPQRRGSTVVQSAPLSSIKQVWNEPVCESQGSETTRSAPSLRSSFIVSGRMRSSIKIVVSLIKPYIRGI